MSMQQAAGNRATQAYLARSGLIGSAAARRAGAGARRGGILARQEVQPKAVEFLQIGSPSALILPGDSPCATKVSAVDNDFDGLGVPMPAEDDGNAQAVVVESHADEPLTVLTVRRGASATLARQQQSGDAGGGGSAPAQSAPAQAAPAPIDPCDLAPIPASGISQFERDVRDGKRTIQGVVLDPETTEIIGYYQNLGTGVWRMVDREGAQADGGEPGVEAPLLDPIDFIPSPGAVVKGVGVIGKVGLKVLGKFTAKKAGSGLLRVSAITLPRLRKVSLALFKAAEKEAAEKAAQTAAKAATNVVAYGSTDLAKKAIAFRLAKKITSARNVAVFEYVENGVSKTFTMASERGVGHSERLIATELVEKQGIDPKNVRRIYSELEPCLAPGGYCKAFIGQNFPNAAVTWSFEYGVTQESRQAGVQALLKAVAGIFK